MLYITQVLPVGSLHVDLYENSCGFPFFVENYQRKGKYQIATGKITHAVIC